MMDLIHCCASNLSDFQLGHEEQQVFDILNSSFLLNLHFANYTLPPAKIKEMKHPAFPGL